MTLRPGWIEDAPELARAIGQWGVVKNLSRAPWPYTLGHAEAFLGAPHAPTEALLILAPDMSGDRIIGGIGLRPNEHDRWELGYWLIPEARGNGYAVEAARGLIDHAREVLRLPEIEAGYAVDNIASARVLDRLGFRPTGERLTTACMARGEPVETVRMRYAVPLASSPAPARIAA
ncbi:GNAT family N-acetyltransferase [Stakelama sp. CBK3Z-3]|uniref:GNAT family N-acetyltransferase n=1 Tax=Stakelama flava TaxID=2860338 RepID=A0ABS6XJL7_9SPHN|nr:GNAT family N-acetyltransferase [Stakelama flava]